MTLGQASAILLAMPAMSTAVSFVVVATNPIYLRGMWDFLRVTTDDPPGDVHELQHVLLVLAGGLMLFALCMFQLAVQP